MIRRELMVGSVIVLAGGVFLLDLLGTPDGAFAVLYIAVILHLAPLHRRWVIGAGCGTAMLTAAVFVWRHPSGVASGGYSRLAVSLVAIGVTTVLSLRHRSTRDTVREQAWMLELTHDTVIIRDASDVILYWNDGAEQLYGWSRAEAVGRICGELLKCAFPSAEVAAALEVHGQWSGEVVRLRRDGARLVLGSRLLRRRDPHGGPNGVIELSADLTEQRRADAKRSASERRYRTMFDTAGFATWEADWSPTMRVVTQSAPADQDLKTWLAAHPDLVQSAVGSAVIRNANQAAVDLFQAPSRRDLIGSNLSARYLPEEMPAFVHILSTLAGGAEGAEIETRMRTLDGRVAEVVMRLTVLPEGERWSHMLIMTFDVTERNEARARIEQTSAALAHAGRVSILGQLAASIAHEVNQPLTAILNYGKSGRRWLSRAEPDLEEVAGCLEKIISNGTRAADIIGRVRALARKAAPRTEPLNLAELVEEAMALIQHEARAADVTLRRAGQGDVPPVFGDRVQVQQVLVNLLMNGLQAMREVDGGGKELRVLTEPLAEGMVRVAVEDRGAGFRDGDAARIFEPFFSTKADGMGMGLSICRSIIEAQGGQISAANNDGPGATVSFTLPVRPAIAPARRPAPIP
jgi:PAS domain S-box-containing protein